VTTCPKTGKLRYRDELGARIALAKLQSRRSSKRRLERRYYHCPFCSGWHLTSKELRK